jgi:hypothetical protein
MITQIFQRLKDNQETIKRLKRKSKKQQKLLFDLEDSLIHQEEFLKVLKIYTQKLVQKHQIDWGIVEKELKENCSPCVCVFRSIEKFVRQGQTEFPIKDNPKEQLINNK